MLGINWLMTLLASPLEVFWIYAPRSLSAAIYMIKGWLSVIGGKDLVTADPSGASACLASWASHDKPTLTYVALAR